jgi:hypothetical protein
MKLYRPRARAALTILTCLLLVLTAACRSRRATPEDCLRIFDRMVDLELKELGYRDPALSELKRQQLGRSLASEINQCEGGRLSPSALSCVEGARTAEEISHQCLP